MRIEEKFEDVLQNIEAAVTACFRKNRELTDYNAKQAYDVLVREYSTELTGKKIQIPALNAQDRLLYEAARKVCDWRLGRRALDESEVVGKSGVKARLKKLFGGPAPATPLALADMVDCLKRLRSSVDFWTKKTGRQGYLLYVDGFMG